MLNYFKKNKRTKVGIMMSENNLVYLDSLCKVEISMRGLEFYLNMVIEDYSELFIYSRDATRSTRAEIIHDNLKRYLDEVKSVLEKGKKELE